MIILADPINNPRSEIRIYNRVGGGYTALYADREKYIPPEPLNILNYVAQYFSDAPVFKDHAL